MKKFDKKGKKNNKEREDVVLNVKHGEDKYSSVKSSQKSSNKKFLNNPTVKKMNKANIILNTQSFADEDFNAKKSKSPRNNLKSLSSMMIASQNASQAEEPPILLNQNSGGVGGVSLSPRNVAT